MIIFDDLARTLRLNVHDLVEGPAVSGEPAAPASIRRAQDGTRIHSEHLAQHAGTDYRKEVVVSFELDRSGYRVTIDGRIDGLRQTPAGVVVEEIKSYAGPAGAVPTGDAHRPHAEQCAFYCLLLAMGGTPVSRGIVRYIALADSRSHDVDIGFAPADWRRRLDERLGRIMDDHVTGCRRARARADYARMLPFPFSDIRESQGTMMHDVSAAADDGRTMICCAPTGVGKTAASLHPMLRHALMADGRLVFLTAKVSQQELALDTLRKMIRPGAEISAVQITAKERTCPFREMRCVAGVCPSLTNFAARLEHSGLVPELLGLGVADGETIRQAAVGQRLCPLEVSLALADRATAVVCDYNYVFEPNVSFKRLFEGAAERGFLIVDEAHNLPGRVSGYNSPELRADDMRALSATCRHMGTAVHTAAAAVLDAVAGRLADGLSALAAEREPAAEYESEPDRQFFEHVYADLDELIAEYVLHTGAGGPPTSFAPTGRRRTRAHEDPLLTELFVLRTFCQCCGHDPALFATIWRTDGRVRMLCLDPAPFIRDCVGRFRSALFMSATLTPFDFYARMLGADSPATVALDLPSPFPPENRLLLAVDSVDTTFRLRSRDAQAIADIISATVRLRAGNYLAFFPSFAFRDEVVERMDAAGVRLIIQQPAMKTDAVLQDLTGNVTETILLCAVQGGVFAEGVDYPGHLAIGAFIIGPGLPAVSPEQELVRRYFEAHTGSGFAYAYVGPGINRAVQSGGRVIRSPTDRGFVMLLCRRFTQSLYRSRLPAYWQDELIVSADPVEEVRRFWERAAPPSS